MKITMANKDHIARLIAEKAYKMPVGGENDVRYNNMLRVSEALERTGEIGSPFRSLGDFKKIKLPPMGTKKEDVLIETDRTYFDALIEALRFVNAA